MANGEKIAMWVFIGIAIVIACAAIIYTTQVHPEQTVNDIILQIKELGEINGISGENNVGIVDGKPGADGQPGAD